MSDRVSITITNGVAHVQFTRPDKRNALDTKQFQAIVAAGEQMKTEPGVRVVVLSGEGASFCAGLDFSAMQSLANATPDSDETSAISIQAGRITHLGQQSAWVWQEVPVPVIAAVHGHALGGGIQIALGADIRIVHPDTKLSVREVHWGLIPDMTGTQVLSSLVRPDVAKELTMTARIFSGTEAYALGLATKLSDTPLEDAMAMAKEIAARSPHAVRGTKDLFNRIANAGAAEQFAAERQTIGTLIGGANQVEAVLANFENRSPRFVDVS